MINDENASSKSEHCLITENNDLQIKQCLISVIRYMTRLNYKQHYWLFMMNLENVQQMDVFGIIQQQ